MHRHIKMFEISDTFRSNHPSIGYFRTTARYRYNTSFIIFFTKNDCILNRIVTPGANLLLSIPSITYLFTFIQIHTPCIPSSEDCFTALSGPFFFYSGSKQWPSRLHQLYFTWSCFNRPMASTCQRVWEDEGEVSRSCT